MADISMQPGRAPTAALTPGVVVNPDGSITTVNPDGTRTTTRADGTVIPTATSWSVDRSGAPTRSWVDDKGQTIVERTANDPNGKPVTFQEIVGPDGSRRPNMDDPATAKAFGADLSNYLSDPGNHLTRRIGNAAATAAASLVGLGPFTSRVLTDPNAKAKIVSGPGSDGSGGGGSGGSGAGGGGINTDAISAAAAASRAMSDKFLADYNNAHPNQPPTMTAAQLPPAAQAEMLGQIQASQAAGLDPIKAAQAAGLDPIKAAQAAGLDPIKASLAAALDPFSATHATATLLDPTQQAEQRARALGLEEQYGDVISGKAPSVAELQLREAEQRQEANQLGLASRASGGGNVALALRTAANNIGRLNQGSAADAAILRAKEIEAAREGLGGLITNTRTGDISFAGQNANLATDVSKTNAGLDTSATLKAAELEAARRAANAGLSTSTALKDAELEAARRGANASLTTSAALKDADLEAARRQYNAGLISAAALKDAELEAARRASNASLTTSTAIKDAELEAARRAANASAINQTSIAQGGFNNTAASNNLTAALEQQRIDAAAKDAAAKNAIASSGQVITGTVGAAQAQAEAVKAAQAAKAAQDAKDAAYLGAGGAAGAKLLTSIKSDDDKDKITYGTNGAPIVD